MNNNFYDFLLFLSATLLALLAFVNELPDKKITNVLKKLYFKSLIIIIAVCIGIWGTRGKETNTKQEAKAETKKQDIENKKEAEKSAQKIVTTFTEALAKYGLKLDNQKDEITKFVRDSAKHTNIRIIRDDEPELDIQQVTIQEKKKDTLKVLLPLMCKKAKAKNIYIRVYICTEDVGSRFYLFPVSNEKTIDNFSIITDAVKYIGFTISGPFANVNSYHFLIVGHYQNQHNKEIPLKILISYNIFTQTCSTPINPLDNKLYSFFHSAGVKF